MINKLIILNLLSYQTSGPGKLIELCNIELKFAYLELRELEPTHLLLEALVSVILEDYGCVALGEHVVLPGCLYILFVYV